MRKLIILLFISIPFIEMRSSCSDTFNAAIFGALDTRDADLERCESASFPSRCANEAQLYFNRSCDIASAAFINCVNIQ